MPAALTFDQQIANLIALYRTKAADGLTWPELIDLVKAFVETAMQFAADLQQPGADKRALVLAAVGQLLDVVLAYLNLPFLPWWLRLALPYFLPLIRQAVIDTADAWLEKTYLQKFADPAPE